MLKLTNYLKMSSNQLTEKEFIYQAYPQIKNELIGRFVNKDCKDCKNCKDCKDCNWKIDFIVNKFNNSRNIINKSFEEINKQLKNDGIIVNSKMENNEYYVTMIYQILSINMSSHRKSDFYIIFE